MTSTRWYCGLLEGLPGDSKRRLSSDVASQHSLRQPAFEAGLEGFGQRGDVRMQSPRLN